MNIPPEKPCCHECGHHGVGCIPSCYPTHCHNPSCKCHKPINAGYVDSRTLEERESDSKIGYTVTSTSDKPMTSECEWCKANGKAKSCSWCSRPFSENLEDRFDKGIIGWLNDNAPLTDIKSFIHRIEQEAREDERRKLIAKVVGMKCDEKKTHEFGSDGMECQVAESYSEKMLVNSVLSDIVKYLEARAGNKSEGVC